MTVTESMFTERRPYQPLAARMRPKELSEYAGQKHLLADDKPLMKAVSQGVLHSLVLWGPPGVGKTTLAKLMANKANAKFHQISAVTSGIKEIREALSIADQAAAMGQKTLLFVDEIHRFNKSQQDAFLPHIEEGRFVMLGATTENPSFELNNALLSRMRVYKLMPLTDDEIRDVIEHALTTDTELSDRDIQIDEDAYATLIKAAQGDARRALGLLETISDLIDRNRVTSTDLELALGDQYRRFDKGGERWYEQISALHKSVRGSDPDASLYWFMRMIDGGCDPLYIARRVVRMASEEIGNADPRALQVALNAWDVQTRLGSPEGELTIAQAVLYLASAPKSNAVYTAFNDARAFVAGSDDLEVPNHLCNAPTKLMKEQGVGDGYRYAHDYPNAFAAGECYLPREVAGVKFYNPVDRGLEIKIREKLTHLAQINSDSDWKRYDHD